MKSISAHIVLAWKMASHTPNQTKRKVKEVSTNFSYIKARPDAHTLADRHTHIHSRACTMEQFCGAAVGDMMMLYR